MKIAVLADIHANHAALEACMKKIGELGADRIVFLGDYVTDCPYPRKTMEMLYSAQEVYPCYFVRGNREDYLLSHRRDLTDGWHYCSQSGSLLYTYEELNERDLRFFEDMPVGMEIRIDGYPIFSACHGTMYDNRRLFGAESEDISDIIKEQATELMVCGHNHKPYTYSSGGKRIINPGSVTGEKACMLMLTSDGGDWQAEHFELDYDVRKMVGEFKESGLLEKADVWARGIIATMKGGKGDADLKVVEYVRKRCAETGKPIDTEEFWQEAAEKLGI